MAEATFQNFDERALPIDPNLPPEALIRAAIAVFGRKIGLSCSFGGPGGMVLLDMAVAADPKVDVFVLDTDFLFPDTYSLITRLEARYGISVRRVKSQLTPAEQAMQHGKALWTRAPDQCCQLRKVEPMQRAVAGLDAWITAIRRDQSSTRAATSNVSWDEGFGIWKIAPLAGWSEQQVMDYVTAHDVPMNPLLFEGYTSLGCTHCTRKPTSDDPRSGRWAGLGKTECGLHARPTTSATSTTDSPVRITVSATSKPAPSDR